MLQGSGRVKRRRRSNARRTAQSRRGDNVTTDEFIELAERLSGEELDELFETWLFTPGRPELATAMATATATATAATAAAASESAGRAARLETVLRRADARR